MPDIYSMLDLNEIHHGDCLDVLKTLADNSVDSIVTDPPYGLNFMGKKWDYDVPSEAIWKECLRVLKPGGHLVSFAGSRTYHRMAVRVEDAGFEIRDQLMWVYGSGFPKSLDVSKAIDKAGPSGQMPYAEFAGHYEERRKAMGLTHAQVCAAGGWHGEVNHGGTSANWANGHGMPTIDQWQTLQPLLRLADKWKVRVEREQYEREIIGSRKASRGVAFTSDGLDELNITAPATDAAKQWDGWGTALKPAHEPIVLARKPFPGTVAANVQQHGTGALNIDGCRIEGESTLVKRPAGSLGRMNDDGWQPKEGFNGSALGRWPANLLHDGSPEVLAGFPTSSVTGARTPKSKAATVEGTAWLTDNHESTEYTDKGSAARFFYSPKASKKDRDEGLEGFELGPPPASARSNPAPGRENALGNPRANSHPTVKPTAVMQWLCRLITPPGGVILDPFTGSGSTGKAALLEGFRFIGIEREAEYVDIARARIAAARPNSQPTLPPPVKHIQHELFD